MGAGLSVRHTQTNGHAGTATLRTQQEAHLADADNTPWHHDNLFAGSLTIDTPEQVGLELPVAGIGSRLLALLADSLLQLGVGILFGILVLLLLTAAPSLGHSMGRMAKAGSGAKKWALALLILVPFLLQWGYFALFEAFCNGQTPGKRWLKVRVLSESGRPITLFESLARNLLRIVDFLPSLYLVGMVTMLCNRRSQRLGDLVAGTLVVHETHSAAEPLRVPTSPSSSFDTPVQSTAAAGLPASDHLARLGVNERQVLETFFARNIDLPLDVRSDMAGRIMQELSHRMQWAPNEEATTHPERLLERLLTTLRDR
jgi:uncharacterized RDD family membrane protein YckC